MSTCHLQLRMKKWSLLSFLLFMLIGSLSTAASSFAYDLLDYYPLTVGSHWEEANDDYVTIIEDYGQINGRSAIAMRSYESDPFVRDEDVIMSYDSNYLYFDAIQEYDNDMGYGPGLYQFNPPVQIKRNLSIGETTSFSTTMVVPDGRTTQISDSYQLVRVESVSVPAGNFPDCLVLEQRVNGNIKDIYWWARGVGYVKDCDDEACWVVGSYYVPDSQTYNDPVISSFTTTPASGTAPLAVTFNCSATDPDGGNIIQYQWDINNDGTVDGTTTVGNFQYAYNTAGTYQATCTVVDDEGATAKSSPVAITATSTPHTDVLTPPSGPSVWLYATVENPVATPANAAACNPFVAGNLSSGMLNLQVGLPAFSSGVDIYLALQSNVLAGGALLLFDQNRNIQPVSTVLSPWKTNISTAVNESLYGNIPTFFLPAGVYNLYTLVTPAGEANFSSYYLWATSFNINH